MSDVCPTLGTFFNKYRKELEQHQKVIRRQNPHAVGAQAYVLGKATALGYLIADQCLEIGGSTAVHCKESLEKKESSCSVFQEIMCSSVAGKVSPPL